MGEVFLTPRGMAEAMFEKALLDSYTVDRLEEIGYFTAPASKGHHLARPGGLLEHSVNVTRWLEKLTEARVVRWEHEESPYRIGMLHDLVKCKCYATDPASFEPGSSGRKYIYMQSVYPGHGAASALIAMSEIGVCLTPVECACIVHHMGAFGLNDRQLKEYDAALDVYPREIIATHTADILAARVDEGGSLSMTYAQFVAKVSEMRNAQKSYFRTRSPEFLNRSKSLEREVDKCIADFYDPQGCLFDGVKE